MTTKMLIVISFEEWIYDLKAVTIAYIYIYRYISVCALNICCNRAATGTIIGIELIN